MPEPLPGPPPPPPAPGSAAPARPFVFGLLGGIASGKSTAGRLLAGPDGLVLSADEIAHEVLASDELAELVRSEWGPAYLGPEGRPDRRALAALVFDPERGAEARRKLEGWTHPRVRARILGRLEEARRAGVPRVALDVPLLLENDAQHGLVARCDALVFVDAPDDARERRARRKRGWEPGEVARREAAQLPLAEKRARADLILPNDARPQDLERAVARALERLGLEG